MPQAQSADATVPVAATAVTGAADTESPYTFSFNIAAVAMYRAGNDKNYTLFDTRHWRAYSEINAHDLNLGWAPGMDASVMVKNKDLGVEVRYFGLEEWSESKSAFDLTRLSFAEASGKYQSWLHNAELNLHWWPCANDRYNLLAGFRWIQLKERISGDTYSNGTQTWNDDDYRYRGRTRSDNNGLYGGQIGIEGLLFGKRDQGFSLDSSVKVGLFGNRINTTHKGWGYGENYDYDYSNDDHRTKTTVVSEVGVNLNYAFTKHIAMTVGYQFLNLGRVALASQDDKTKSVIYHGIRTGLTFAF